MMKKLACTGSGITAFINKHVSDKFERVSVLGRDKEDKKHRTQYLCFF
jgi:hypothetical protein